MAWPDPMVAPLEALEWFRASVSVTPRVWLRLAAASRRRAFTVAGVTRLQLVSEVWQALERALEQGLPFEQFQSQVGERLTKAWGDTVTNPSARLETIYRANMQSAYAAGRYAQMTDPDVLAARPNWLYDSVLDSHTTPLCTALNGTLLPADHEFWLTRYPPNHFGCRAGVRSVTRSGTERRGGLTEAPPVLNAAPGWQTIPSLEDWTPDLSNYPPPVVAEYQRLQRGAAP